MDKTQTPHRKTPLVNLGIEPRPSCCKVKVLWGNVCKKISWPVVTWRCAVIYWYLIIYNTYKWASMHFVQKSTQNLITHQPQDITGPCHMPYLSLLIISYYTFLAPLFKFRFFGISLSSFWYCCCVWYFYYLQFVCFLSCKHSPR